MSIDQTIICNNCGHTEATLGSHNVVTCASCEAVTNERNKAILKFLIDEHLDEKYHLIYVYRDDIEDKTVIEMIVKDEYEALWEHFSEYEMEGRYEGAKYHLEQLQTIVEADERFGPDAWEAFAYTEGHDELRYAIEERDESDMIGDLIRNSGNQWFSYDLDFDTHDYDAGDDEDRERFVKDFALHLNVSVTDDVQASLLHVLDNSSGSLHLFWSGDLHDVYTNRDESNNFLRIAGANITDLYGGWDTKFDTEVLVSFTRDNLDHVKARYYADQVCGMVKSPFQASPNFETLTVEQAQVEAQQMHRDLR